MLLSLGLFVFEMATAPYDELTHTLSWKYAASARFGERDAFQFVGYGDETVSITGAIVPEITGDTTSLDSLAEMADSGEGLELVDGLGNVFGSFVIERIDRRRTWLLDNGVPRKTEFTLDLKRVD